MHIHILGICGTFMAGIAVLANELGFKVTGSDSNIYPPMSEQLDNMDIQLFLQHKVADLRSLQPDLIVIGNVMRRGMEVIEYILDERLAYISGPEFLAKYILPRKHVLAVAGTHGKTTTSAILTWILEYAGLKPGYLIGGVAKNFPTTAHIGQGNYFVIEADEYDCAFFDKRSKFMHYNPHTLIINNLEFDHADIFNNLAEIKQQFHNLIRSLPSNATVIYNATDNNIKDLLAMGCWSKQEDFALQQATWDLQKVGSINWALLGEFNTLNAIAAIAAAYSATVPIATALEALTKFKGVSRRLELICTEPKNNIKVYSDFAHHPTAINLTINAAKIELASKSRLIVIIDLGSNTMCLGVHQEALGNAIKKADVVYIYNGKDVQWDVNTILISAHKTGGVFSNPDLLLDHLFSDLTLNKNDVILLMSNGGFGNIRQNLCAKLINN